LLISSSPILDFFFVVLLYFSWVCVIFLFYSRIILSFLFFSWCSSKYNLEKKTKSFKRDFWKIAKKVVRHQAWRNMLELSGYISLNEIQGVLTLCEFHYCGFLNFPDH
jgi:hypothetical protein